MRELKFRAWVYYGDELEKPHYSRDYGSLDMFFEDHSENDIDQCIEQYTGFKDRNGKEIYEGDIVEAPIYGVWTTGNSDAIFGDKIWKLLVIWSDADCGFLFKVIGSKKQPNRVYDILDQHLGAFEVIGNTHENPELIKEAK